MSNQTKFVADVYEVEELACHLLGLNYDDVDNSDISDALFEKYEISFDQFHNLITALLPLIDVGTSPLSNTRYKGFSKVEGGVGMWLVRTEVDKHKK